MKIINKKWILISLIAVLSFACEKKLEVNPISNVGADSFYKTESDLQQALIASYDALQNRGQYGFYYMMLMEIRSDNAFVESPTNVGGEYGEIDSFKLTSGNSRISSAWNSAYAGIQRTNIVLNRIDDIEMDASVKNKLSGEAKFLRGLTYFNLVRLWGDVPLVLEETKDPFKAFSIGRTPVKDVYAQIVTDLTEAITTLPQKTEAGRASKGAAQALLGKVQLTLGNYSAAETVLREVTGFSLQPNFADNFGIANENGIESIFEVQFQAGMGEGSRYPNEVAPVGSAKELLNGIGSQRGENIPTNMLYDSFEDNDLRRDASIGVLSNGVTKYAKKLIDIPLTDYDSGVNVIVLRYADVLLMLSEALNEQSYVADGEAFNLLNQIRDRAGLDPLTSTKLTSKEAFRDAVFEERRHEFVSENQRWFDLLRMGKAKEVMNASTSAFSVSDYQLLYPIPLSALDAINNQEIFPQNPGY